MALYTDEVRLAGDKIYQRLFGNLLPLLNNVPEQLLNKADRFTLVIETRHKSIRGLQLQKYFEAIENFVGYSDKPSPNPIIFKEYDKRMIEKGTVTIEQGVYLNTYDNMIKGECITIHIEMSVARPVISEVNCYMIDVLTHKFYPDYVNSPINVDIEVDNYLDTILKHLSSYIGAK